VTSLLAIEPVTAARIAEQSVKALIIVVILFVGFRLTGKRELSQLNVYDLVMLMALSNAVQNAMTGGLGNLPIGLAVSSTIVVAAWAITRFVTRRPQVHRALFGTPTILAINGQPIRGRIKRAELSQAELTQACRERGVSDLSECKMVVLETDGSLSIIANDSHQEQKPTRPRPKRHRRRRG
jgi:uncharacterized membrane protein YcaP (DUF421 family)